MQAAPEAEKPSAAAASANPEQQQPSAALLPGSLSEQQIDEEEQDRKLQVILQMLQPYAHHPTI